MVEWRERIDHGFFNVPINGYLLIRWRGSYRTDPVCWYHNHYHGINYYHGIRTEFDLRTLVDLKHRIDGPAVIARTRRDWYYKGIKICTKND